MVSELVEKELVDITIGDLINLIDLMRVGDSQTAELVFEKFNYYYPRESLLIREIRHAIVGAGIAATIRGKGKRIEKVRRILNENRTR